MATYTYVDFGYRYADHNEYKSFKRTVHDSLHPGENQPPLPHARTWFPEENRHESAGTRRRRNNTTDNTNNSGDDDDEIEMVGMVTNLRCPLSLQVSPLFPSLQFFSLEARGLFLSRDTGLVFSAWLVSFGATLYHRENYILTGPS